MLRSPTVIASNDDSESEISLYKVKKGVFFNEVSCFVCQGMVTGLDYFLQLWGLFLLFLYFYQVNQLQWLLNRRVSIAFTYLAFTRLVLFLVILSLIFSFLLFISNPSAVMYLTKQITFYGCF